MYILFSLLRTNSLHMFRALLSHPQESLHKRHLVYCLRVISVGCTTRTQFTKSGLGSAPWGWASNDRNMLRPLILVKWIKSASRWFHYTDIRTMVHGQQTIKFDMVVTKLHCCGSRVVYFMYLFYRSAIFLNWLTEDSFLKVDISSNKPKVFHLVWKMVYYHMTLI
jgi:hypothetical protein